MKRIILHLPIFISCLLLIKSVTGQEQNEYFEGIIEFEHIVTPKDSNYNVNYDYGGIGTSSTYYFKEGNLMFKNKNGYFKKSIFKSKENRVFLFTVQSDTVMTLDGRLNDADLIDYRFEDFDEQILGYDCKILIIKLKPKGREYPVSTRRYFYPKAILINGSQFNDCYATFYNLVYGESNSVPLRIEYEWPNRIVRWEAKSIEKKNLDIKLFKIDVNTILEQMN